MDKGINEFDLKAKEWDSDPAKIERSRVIANAILEKVHPSPEFSAFEYGGGTGVLSFFLQPYLKKIVVADSSKGMLDVVKSKIEKFSVKNVVTLELDLTESEPVDEKFDMVYSLLTMHHVGNIQTILNKLFSMLKKNGYLCISDLDKEDGSFHGEGFTGHHGFDRGELLSMAEKAGFSNVEFDTVYKLVREKDGGKKREYPLFMMVCRRLH